LLKSQLKSDNGFADQVFITTCDADFKNLLEYKMSSAGIGIKILNFLSYGNTVEHNI
jgi:hypothetical protein